MRKSIYCIGGATIDHKLKSLAPIVAESSNPVESYTTLGGVARNVAANLAQWTQSIHLQCIVGDDNEGYRILNEMQKLSVNTSSSLQLAHAPTAHYYAFLDDQGDLYCAAIDMQIYHSIEPSLITKHWQTWSSKSIVFIDTNMPKNIIDALRLFCIETEAILCIDPVSVTKTAQIPADLTGVYLIKPNQLEASQLSNIIISSIQDCFVAARILLKRGVQHVVISLGENGYVLMNDDEARHIPCHFPIKVVDVNGAGDAFVAGILLGLQQEMSLKEACELGAVAASKTLQSMQTVPYIPTIELMKLINNLDIPITPQDASSNISFCGEF